MQVAQIRLAESRPQVNHQQVADDPPPATAMLVARMVERRQVAINRRAATAILVAQIRLAEPRPQVNHQRMADNPPPAIAMLVAQIRLAESRPRVAQRSPAVPQHRAVPNQ